MEPTEAYTNYINFSITSSIYQMIYLDLGISICYKLNYEMY